MAVARVVLLSLVASLIAIPLAAATYIVPTDADLVRAADAVAVVRVQSSHSYFTPDGSIATDHSVVVEQAVKGTLRAGMEVTVTQRGGSVGSLALHVSSEPPFVAGERTLLALTRAGRGRFAVAAGELGKFNFVTDADARQLLVRGATADEIFGWDVAGERHREEARDAAAFLRYVARVAAGEEPRADYFLPARAAAAAPVSVESHVAGNDYMTLFDVGGTRRGGRWPTGGFTMQSVGTQAAVPNLSAAIDAARNAWNGDPSSNINIGYSGTGSGSYGQNDGKFLILLDQPDSGPLAGNVVGQANVWADSNTNTNGSDVYFTALDCDIIMQVGLSGSLFESVLGHEMGHCLGFRHSNQPQSGQTTSSSNALMNSNAPSTVSLRSWDQDAASHVYGSGASACTAPSITTHPQSTSITSGQSTTLSVSAAGTAPLTYQWFTGTSGNTGSPIAGATSASVNVTPTSTTSYWVRVTGQCGTPASSNTATVTVNTSSCTPPSIASQPTSRSINAGSPTTLSVTATGTGPLTYQWYVGNSGTVTNPVAGGTAANLTVTPAVTTTYWVRVTGQCGSPADSTAATVTIASCNPPSIVTQPQSTSITSGQSATLTVGAVGTGLQYQWFIGTRGTVTNPVAGANSATLTVTPSTTTTYWVLVSGTCGDVQSTAATVTVTAVCVPPSITVQPQSGTVTAGQSTTVSVTAAGTALTYQWFTGASGNTSSPIAGATASTLSVTPAATTTYWVRVSGQCGSPVDSAAATVTVATACTAPTITAKTASQSVSRGSQVTLSVTATGTSLQYAWFEGAVGDESRPAGTTATITTAPITSATTFWVRVKNECGEATSDAISLSVPSSKRRSVRK